MQLLNVREMAIKIESIIFNDNDVEGDEFKIMPIIFKKISNEKDGSYTLKLKLNIDNTNENPFPITLQVVICANFVFQNIVKEEAELFLNTQGIQIVYPYLRSAVANITANAMIPSINLPLLSLNDILDM